MCEQVEGSVQDVIHDRIRPINFVDDHDGPVSQRERLA